MLTHSLCFCFDMEHARVCCRRSATGGTLPKLTDDLSHPCPVGAKIPHRDKPFPLSDALFSRCRSLLALFSRFRAESSTACDRVASRKTLRAPGGRLDVDMEGKYHRYKNSSLGMKAGAPSHHSAIVQTTTDWASSPSGARKLVNPTHVGITPR